MIDGTALGFREGQLSCEIQKTKIPFLELLVPLQALILG
jgi:hypothetical protein